MIDAWGIQHRYRDASGVERVVAPETVARLREAIGEPRQRPAALVTRPGSALDVEPGELVLEDGARLEVAGRLPSSLPLGYHALRDRRGALRRVVVSPGRCYLPEGLRAWGFAVQLYAARSRRSWGLGDLRDLAALAAWSAGEHGAGFALVSPLHGVAPTDAQQASPYFPASRSFRNPIYLCVEDVPGAERLGVALESAAAAGRALNGERRLDRNAVWRAKRAALATIWEAVGGGPAFDAWLDAQGDALLCWATWCALVDAFGPRWRAWAPEYRSPASAAVTRFRREHANCVRFHAWLQWLCERQLEAASGHLAVIQDLPIGVDPEGADTWMWQNAFAAGVTVGAPPDAFNARGQNWGVPPFAPSRLQELGYEPFAAGIRATMAAAGGLRVDHVMGLFRLWWIPEGASPSEGAYVRYPAAELLDVVALESHRARALVVGEDLGTVEDGVREELAARDVLSYKLLWFEGQEPARWPAGSLAAVTTHDLPTVAGLWTGSDLAAQRRLGLAVDEVGTEEVRRRLAVPSGLADDATPEQAVEAAHELLAKSPSALLSATLEDAIAEEERPNVPGADAVRPNWSLALSLPLEEFARHPLAQRVARLLYDATRGRDTAPR